MVVVLGSDAWITECGARYADCELGYISYR
jgi:hypothetical protein